MTESEFARLVAASGGRLYRVGGAVRDFYMGLPEKDRDYVVTGLGEERFSVAFPAAVVTGQAFPVFRLAIDGAFCEVAMARTERKRGAGHTGFVCDAGPGVRLEDDLRRRDLTVNAMAVDPLTGRLFDPFGGLADLRERVLRAVSGAFAEDPLRVYRTARFAAQLFFTVDEGTMRLMRSLVGQLGSLSAERVYEETVKALACREPSTYFRVLYDCGALSAHFSELQGLASVVVCGDLDGGRATEMPEISPIARPGRFSSALAVSLAALDCAAQLTDDSMVRFAALVQFVDSARRQEALWEGGGRDGPPSGDCRELNSGAGADRGGTQNFGRERALAARTLAARIKASARWSAGAVCAAVCAPLLSWPGALSPERAAQLLRAAERSPLGLDGLETVVQAGIFACPAFADAAVRQAAVRRLLPAWKTVVDQVNGRTVKRSPDESGKAYGERLHRARVEQLARLWNDMS